MRETLLTHCERNFVNQAIAEETRLDGRQLLEPRPVKIQFGSNWGCCLVTLGQSRAIAQVSCDIQQPKASRPNEGMLHINVEFNPMAAPFFEAGRQSEAAIMINRQLEQCFKDSKCIDLESLCIVADKKVWNLRVDVNIINHDGNLIDCASIATLAALAHFHRPDVSSNGDEVIVHPFSEKDPLPVTLYHYPVCVSFIAFEKGQIVMDPTHLEERVGMALLTMGINSYRELCSLYFGYLGKTSVVEDVISIVSDAAANYATKLVEQIKEAVKHDVEARYNKDDSNTKRFKDCIASEKLTTMMSERLSIKLSKWSAPEKGETEDVDMEEDDDQCEKDEIIKLGQGSAELITDKGEDIGEGGPNTWVHSESSSDEDSGDDVKLVEEVKQTKVVLDAIELSGDSEEEATEILMSSDTTK